MLLSVVIPTHNRSSVLCRCLDAISPGKQEGVWFIDSETKHPDDPFSLIYEVIVSDDGDTDETRKCVDGNYPWVRWVRCKKQGPGPNRNNGAHLARGEWLVFIDDDCLAVPSFIQAVARAAGQGGIDVVEGKIVCPDKRDNPFYIQPENLTGGVFWTGNLAIRKDCFFELGGFDEDLALRAEDMELAHRIGALGLKTIFAADAVVLHPAEKMSPRQFWARTLSARWLLAQRHKTREATSPNAGIAATIADVCAYRLMFVMRITWHSIRDRFSGGWRIRVFDVLWNWLNLPILIPYLVWWEFRFRRIFKHRTPVVSHSSGPLV